MRVLLVEDDEKTAQYLKKGLSEHAFVVDYASDGFTGWCYTSEIAYDIILLDVMLPGLNGFQLIKRLRQRNQRTPIICLTARDSLADKVEGLELGADDYLTKPFAFSELLARINSLLRRCQSPESTSANRLIVKDLVLELSNMRVTRSKTPIHLTAKEFALLALFMRRKGQILSRTIIAEQIWDINFDSDSNVVDVAVKRLRSKIDKPFTCKLIHTIRGVGYVLEEVARTS